MPRKVLLALSQFNLFLIGKGNPLKQGTVQQSKRHYKRENSSTTYRNFWSRNCWVWNLSLLSGDFACAIACCVHLHDLLSQGKLVYGHVHAFIVECPTLYMIPSLAYTKPKTCGLYKFQGTQLHSWMKQSPYKVGECAFNAISRVFDMKLYM